MADVERLMHQVGYHGVGVGQTDWAVDFEVVGVE